MGVVVYVVYLVLRLLVTSEESRDTETDGGQGHDRRRRGLPEDWRDGKGGGRNGDDLPRSTKLVPVHR